MAAKVMRSLMSETAPARRREASLEEEQTSGSCGNCTGWIESELVN